MGTLVAVPAEKPRSKCEWRLNDLPSPGQCPAMFGLRQAGKSVWEFCSSIALFFTRSMDRRLHPQGAYLLLFIHSENTHKN